MADMRIASDFDQLSTLLTLCALATDHGLSVGGKVGIAIFVILLIICIILIAVCVIMLGLRRKRKPSRKEHRREDLSSLRENLKDYTFKKPDWSSVKSAHIGLFGEMGAGKSSFVNSVEFAFTGQFQQSQAVGAMESQGGKTLSRTCRPLTDSIYLFDNRGINNLKESNVKEMVAQLRGERGPDGQTIVRSEQEEIHCGVLVIKISDFNRTPGIKFISAFAKELRTYNGYPPMIVITHAASLNDEERGFIKTKLAAHDVCENDVWFFDNYTKENSTEDVEKSIKLLKFLDAALKHCELTIVQTHRNKNVTEPNRTLL